MRYIRTLAAIALAITAAACGDSPTGISADGTQPALNTSPLTITSLYCRDVGGGGLYYNHTECNAYTSGGAGGNTYEWSTVIVNYQQDGLNHSYMEGVCTNSYPVTFTVRDSTGASATLSKTFRCYAYSPGSGGGTQP